MNYSWIIFYEKIRLQEQRRDDVSKVVMRRAWKVFLSFLDTFLEISFVCHV